MGVKDLTLKFLLLGDNKSAVGAMKGTEDQTKRTGSAIGKFAGAAAGALAAVGAAKFAKDSISAFGTVAGETAKLQRYIGGTAEDASRLRFAASQSGVGIDELAGGLGKMSKAMASNSKGFKALGVDVLDNQGKMKSVNQVYMETADKLAKMPAGAAKTAAILQIFGKAGMNLGPMLNKGSEGIKKLEAESDKLGTTMSTKDLAATKANTVAKRQFQAAILGLQVSLGRALYPALTIVSTTLAELAPKIGPVLVPMFQLLGSAIKSVLNVVSLFLPVIVQMAGILSGHPRLIQALVIAIVSIVAVTKAWGVVTALQAVLTGEATAATVLQRAALGGLKLAQGLATAAQWLFNAAMSANPIGLVVLAIVALIAVFVLAYMKIGWFRAGVQAAFGAIKSAISGTINWVRSNWPLILAILTGPIGVAVLLITRHWSSIKSGFTEVRNWIGHKVGDIVGFFTGMPGKISRAASGMFHGVTDAFRSAINEIIGGWNRLHFSINVPSVHIPGTNSNIGGGSFGFGVPSIPFLAQGGIAVSPTLAMVGEGREAEAILPLSRLRSLLGQQAAAGAAAGGGLPPVNITGGTFLGTKREIGMWIAQALREYKLAGGQMP